MLDRLVGRAVLAEADAVMGHHVLHRHAHQRREPHRGARVVGEAHEGAAIGPHAAMQRHAVHRRRHAVLADAVIDVAPLAVLGLEDAEIGGLGVVRAGQVGRAAMVSGRIGLMTSSAISEALRVATLGQLSETCFFSARIVADSFFGISPAKAR
jgi:hypothetical protein